jgi:hypothetical protein
VRVAELAGVLSVRPSASLVYLTAVQYMFRAGTRDGRARLAQVTRRCVSTERETARGACGRRGHAMGGAAGFSLHVPYGRTSRTAYDAWYDARRTVGIPKHYNLKKG